MTISVIIPAFNAERFIGQAIRSAIAQILKPAEIIVVDDGSTDSTRDIVASFGGIVLYHYQKNAGPSKARNVGISKASSELIAFLDSDDYWEPEHLLTMKEILNLHPSACMIYCSKNWVDEQGVSLTGTLTQDTFPNGWIFYDMFQANYISSTSVVVSRKCALLEVGGFNESLEMRNAEDYQLWLRMSARYPIASSSQKTVNYRRHDLNLTLDVVSYLRGHIYALESVCSLIDKGGVNEKNNNSLMNVTAYMKQQYESAVITLYHKGEYSATRVFCSKALRKGYWSMPIILRLLFVFMPGRLRKSAHFFRKKVIGLFGICRQPKRC